MTDEELGNLCEKIRGAMHDYDIACRYGYEEAARKIQDLYLDGKKAEAMMAVPNELADEVSLCGPPERIRERIVVWKESGASTLLCSALQVEALRTMAEAAL